MKKRTNRNHHQKAAALNSWRNISGRHAKLAKARKDARVEAKEANNEQRKNDI
jgi:hypothetical protein